VRRRPKMWIHRLINKIFKNNQRKTPSPLISLPRGARKKGDREREVKSHKEIKPSMSG
jgi:hypothetical protein